MEANVSSEKNLFVYYDHGPGMGRLAWLLEPRHLASNCLDLNPDQHSAALCSLPATYWLDCNSGWLRGLNRGVRLKHVERCCVSDHLYYTPFCDVAVTNDLLFFIYSLWQNISHSHLWQTIYEIKFY